MAKVKKPQYKDIIFDSNEEIDFYKWCEQALQKGVITKFMYHPQTFQIFQKQTYDGKPLLRELSYTADYQININPKYYYKLKKLFKVNNLDLKFYIDIKPGFSKFHDISKFSILQKVIWDKMKIYVNKIEIDKLFEESWVPEGSRFTEKKKIQKKKYSDCKLIQEWVDST